MLINGNLAELYSSTGRYKAADFYRKKFVEYQDSLYNQEKLKIVDDAITQYKDSVSMLTISFQEAKILQQKKQSYALIVGLFLLGLIAGVTYFFNRKIKVQSKAIENQNIELSIKNKVIDTQNHEIYHRVKNNLHFLGLMLEEQMENVKDSASKEIMEDVNNRIFTINSVNQLLHQQENLLVINLPKYIQTLTQNISYCIANKAIDIQSQIVDIDIDAEMVQYIGLIVNELMTNAKKYAFENINIPQCSIHIQKAENQIQLIFKDNGNGLPEAFEINEDESFGLGFVATLVEDLYGKITWLVNQGTQFNITIPLKGNKYATE